jgi:hypothetical protein
MGIANEIAEIIHERLPHFDHRAQYRSSFPSFHHFGQFEFNFAEVESKRNPGWLISLSNTQYDRGGNWLTAVSGPYLRLSIDGAVLRRNASGWADSGKTRFHSSYFYFADYSEEEKLSVLRDQ